MESYLKLIIFILTIQSFSACNTVESKTGKITGEVEASNDKSDGRAPLLVSKDFGKTWESATDNLPTEIQVSFLEPIGNEIVLASDNMGIFLSTKNKINWSSIGDKLPSRKINALHVSADKIYAGVYRQGIYQTTDEGKIWKSLNYNLQNLKVQSIFNLDEQLFVGTDEGLFTLLDGTEKWEATGVRAQVLSIYAYDNKLVVGTSQGTLMSQDKGGSWEWLRKQGAIHYTRNIGSRIIELALNGDLVHSDDWGKTWTNTSYGPRKGSYVYEIIEIGDYQLMSNNYGIHRSDDNGEEWEHIFATESIAFFDLIAIGDRVYGGTRAWDEYRKR